MNRSKYFADLKAALAQLRAVLAKGALKAEVTRYLGGYYCHWQEA
jgi:hypothetical protein